MSIYSNNVAILNAIVAQCSTNPLMKNAKWFTTHNCYTVQHNPRNNKRTKPSNSKRKGR